MRLQKFFHVKRAFPDYEIVDDGGNVLFGVTREGSGLELTVHRKAAGATFELDSVVQLLQDAKLKLLNAMPDEG